MEQVYKTKSASVTLRSRTDLVCAAIVLGGAAGLLLAGSLLPHARERLGWFLAGAGPAWALTSGKLWRNRGERPEEGGGLGAATAVTLGRAWLIAAVAGHLFLPVATGVGAVTVALTYTVAAILDGVDGRVARRRAFTSVLGARLDVATDALGILVASLVAIRAGRLPPWYLVLAAAYPTMQIALALRARWGLPVFRERLRPNPRARFFAGVQMGVVATTLYPVLPRWFLWPAATVAMLPTLLMFLREWRIASSPLPLAGEVGGRLRPPGEGAPTTGSGAPAP